MLHDESFLRKLPSVIDGAELVQIEALVFSADAVQANLENIRRIATAYREKIGDAPRSIRVMLFTSAWSIVDCIHVVRQVLRALDYETPMAKSFLEKYESALRLRNRMDHLTGNARNVSSAKGRPPVYGALGYVCVRNEDIVIKDGEHTLTGAGVVSLTAGRVAGGQRMKMVNPAGRELKGYVSAFQFEAFDDVLMLDEAENDLRELIQEIDRKLETQMKEQAERVSKERNIPVEKIMANDAAGLTLFLAFKFNDKN